MIECNRQITALLLSNINLALIRPILALRKIFKFQKYRSTAMPFSCSSHFHITSGFLSYALLTWQSEITLSNVEEYVKFIYP